MKLEGIQIGCGHTEGTIIEIEHGERREGEDWVVKWKEFEFNCKVCGEKARFSISNT